MSDCKAYRRELGGAWDGGELSRAARAHAAACRACGAELRGRESLRALVGGLAKVEAPADFEYRLRARMAASKAEGRRAPLRRLRLVYAFAPVAAAACFLFVSATLYLRQVSTSKPSEPQAAAAPAQNAGPAPVAKPSSPGEAAQSKREGEGDAAAAMNPKLLNVKSVGHSPRTPPARARELAAKSDVRAGARRNTIPAGLDSERAVNGRGVTIALKAPADSLRMILRDERGAGRVVPMRSVSFGSQELIARQGGLNKTVVLENEGVW
jgi:hypothetical protein